MRLILAVGASACLFVACGEDAADEAGVQTLPSVTVAGTLAPSRTPAVSSPSSDATADSDADETGDDLYAEFSQCMRDNGYPDFEDLTGDAFADVASSEAGAAVFQDEMSRRGVDLSDPSTRVPMETCGPILEQMASAAPPLDDEDVQAQETLLLEFAQCMRDSGQTEWPDPDFAANGPTGYSVETMQAIDFDDPDVIAAGQNCDPKREVLAIFGR